MSLIIEHRCKFTHIKEIHGICIEISARAMV